MRVLKSIIYISVFGLLASCAKDSFIPYDGYIVFGHYYDLPLMCPACCGEELEIFKIENESLSKNTENIGGGTSDCDKLYDGKYTRLSSPQYHLVSDLIYKIPGQIVNEDDSLIGQTFGYGYYLELKVNGKRRFWKIDSEKNNLPDYLQAFTDTLNDYITKLQ